MKKLNNKKGISLIVLVITIVVMIILASAIILSLSSSGIIGRANEAKISSDAANKKQAATIALSEYELEKQMGETTKTATKYVQDKLNSQNLDGSDVAVTEDGEILLGLKKSAISAVEKGVKLGDYVSYTPTTATSTKYKVYDEENEIETEFFTTQIDNEETDETALKWKYMGIDKSGNALLVAEVPTVDVFYLSGAEGYLEGPRKLDELCGELYSNENLGEARSIDIEDVNRILDANPIGKYYSEIELKSVENKERLTIGEIVSQKGEPALTNTQVPEKGKSINDYVSDWYTYAGTKYKAEETLEHDLMFKKLTITDEKIIRSDITYWLASSCVYARFYKEKDDANFRVRCVSLGGNVISPVLFDSKGVIGAYAMAVRPVVTLNSDVQFSECSDGVWSIS